MLLAGSAFTQSKSTTNFGYRIHVILFLVNLLNGNRLLFWWSFSGQAVLIIKDATREIKSSTKRMRDICIQ